MPELPEVELVVQDLMKFILPPATVDLFHISCSRLIRGDTVLQEKVAQDIVGEELIAVRRQGKYIFFHFASEKTLICHLKMTGRFVPIEPSVHTVLPYERARIFFKRKSDGSQCGIVFADVRRFGTFQYRTSQHDIVVRLGPEPFDPNFVQQFILSIKRVKTASIKTVLLNQKYIAGVGNIYADEALFRAQISPFRVASSLSQDEVVRLKTSLVTIFDESLKKGGSSLGQGIGNFITPYAVRGKFQQEFLVYHKHGLPCVVCCGFIKRQLICGRAAHFCPKCQK